MEARRSLQVAGLLLVAPLIVVAAWIWVLLAREPHTAALGRRLPWPVACSLRGCVTTRSLTRHLEARTAFNRATKQPAPATAEGLTTLLRQHLVRQAFVRIPVTPQDAVRYREEVLNARDESAVRETVGLTLQDYDTYVILPLLQQEALRSERSVETFDELFTLLARERPVWVLSRGLVWDKANAKVVER